VVCNLVLFCYGRTDNRWLRVLRTVCAAKTVTNKVHPRPTGIIHSNKYEIQQIS